FARPTTAKPSANGQAIAESPYQSSGVSFAGTARVPSARSTARMRACAAKPSGTANRPQQPRQMSPATAAARRSADMMCSLRGARHEASPKGAAPRLTADLREVGLGDQPLLGRGLQLGV